MVSDYAIRALLNLLVISDAMDVDVEPQSESSAGPASPKNPVVSGPELPPEPQQQTYQQERYCIRAQFP